MAKKKFKLKIHWFSIVPFANECGQSKWWSFFMWFQAFDNDDDDDDGVDLSCTVRWRVIDPLTLLGFYQHWKSLEISVFDAHQIHMNTSFGHKLRQNDCARCEIEQSASFSLSVNQIFVQIFIKHSVECKDSVVDVFIMRQSNPTVPFCLHKAHFSFRSDEEKH